MKINRPNVRHQDVNQRLIEVNFLIERLQTNNHRPCPGCTQSCPCSGSQYCNCNCSVDCLQVARQLSSEGDRYPIEINVLPLVFTLRQMNVCEPCWSCEGHLDQNLQLAKLPQVWFYTNSMSLIRLLDEALVVFKARQLLHYSWQICVSYSARDCAVNAFSIKPDLLSEADAQLVDLQNDLLKIANRLSEELLRRSQQYQHQLRQLKSNLSSSVA